LPDITGNRTLDHLLKPGNRVSLDAVDEGKGAGRGALACGVEQIVS
jgi:hypothetical protein